MRITTFCFLMELAGIFSIIIHYLLDGGITSRMQIAMGFLLCACIIYTYARWQEVNA